MEHHHYSGIVPQFEMQPICRISVSSVMWYRGRMTLTHHQNTVMKVPRNVEYLSYDPPHSGAEDDIQYCNHC